MKLTKPEIIATFAGAVAGVPFGNNVPALTVLTVTYGAAVGYALQQWCAQKLDNALDNLNVKDSKHLNLTLQKQ